MAQKTYTGGQDASLCAEAACLRRRRELEDMPTTHIDARSAEADAQSTGLDAVSGLLAEQNRLLCDILGAVNALTAAQLAAARRPG